MRLTELFESATEVRSLHVVAQAVVSYIQQMINQFKTQDAVHKKLTYRAMDLDATEEDQQAYLKSKYPKFNPDEHDEDKERGGPSRYKGLSTEQYEELWDEYSLDLADLFRGKQSLKQLQGKQYATSEVEVGQVGDIIRRAGVDVSQIEQHVFDAIKDTYVVINDATVPLGSYQNAESAGETTGMPVRAGVLTLSGPYFLSGDRIAIKKISNLIAHELTHNLDDVNTGGKFKSGAYDGTWASYNKHNSEVNARYTEVIQDVQRKIDRDPNVMQRDAFLKQLERAMTRHHMGRDEIDDLQRRQIIKRALAHFDIQ